ncbi:MAG: 16S rRNA processing protein RimM [Bacteroidetes bacterium]|nr:16S rRNA processing protein RimM [Bacteroidota bacterium]
MDKKDFFYLGTFSKTYGLKGELNIALDVDNPDKYKKLESIFVEFNEQLVPFFIEEILVKSQQKTAIVKLADVVTIDKAKTLIGHSIFLPLSMLPPLKGNKFYFHEIIGFDVEDVEFGYVGKVDMVIDSLQHPILQIKREYKEVLIPLIDEFIIKVDRKNKKLEIKAPEGLIELYL